MGAFAPEDRYRGHLSPSGKQKKGLPVTGLRPAGESGISTVTAWRGVPPRILRHLPNAVVIWIGQTGCQGQVDSTFKYCPKCAFPPPRAAPPSSMALRGRAFSRQDHAIRTRNESMGSIALSPPRHAVRSPRFHRVQWTMLLSTRHVVAV